MFLWVLENVVTAVVGGAGEVVLEMAISRWGKKLRESIQQHILAVLLSEMLLSLSFKGGVIVGPLH